MFKTGKQTTQAVRQIKRMTKWSLRRISRETGINHTTVWHLFKGKVDNPTQETMNSVEVLLAEVEQL